MRASMLIIKSTYNSFIIEVYQYWQVHYWYLNSDIYNLWNNIWAIYTFDVLYVPKHLKDLIQILVVSWFYWQTTSLGLIRIYNIYVSYITVRIYKGAISSGKCSNQFLHQNFVRWSFFSSEFSLSESEEIFILSIICLGVFFSLTTHLHSSKNTWG